MSKEGRGEEKGTNAVTLCTMINESSLRLDDEHEQLLPGLPDEIILDQIVPKLPWRAFRVLSSVSPRWRQGIQSREVYDARVRSHSTETLVVLNHFHGGDKVLSLYSARDDSWYQLPEFPKCRESRRGIPRSCHCLSLDGKIYILEEDKGFADIDSLNSDDDDDDDFDYDDRSNDCSEVHVLDLAGQREWKQCANMPQPRFAFGCGVLDGKIYVLGGRTSEWKPTCESVVYDPKENSWTSIMPMKYQRAHPDVVAVGEELFVHGGKHHFYNRHLGYRGLLSDEGIRNIIEIYHPGKDEWRKVVIEPFWGDKPGRILTAQGKLHMLTPVGISGHGIDSDGNYSWTRLHSFSIGDIDEEDWDDMYVFEVCEAQAVNDELLALLNSSDGAKTQTVLYQSKGFGGESEDILWETVSCQTLEDHHRFPHFMCSIEL